MTLRDVWRNMVWRFQEWRRRHVEFEVGDCIVCAIGRWSTERRLELFLRAIGRTRCSD